MELSNLTFNEDYMEVSIDILSVSDELQEEINKSIEIAKVEETEKQKRFYEEYPELIKKQYAWSDKPVVIQFHYLSITLESGKPNRYSIETGFADAENEEIYGMASTTVDLSEYENEIKKAVINVLVEKFF